ncbi:hypothetical protein SCHPADRAFT_263309 [Schizopora paradoxa]|uniref:Uncharacterized protein n=1 Tax=Schizopora paradoxa TaxID=27342 RepID=A0A0H2RV78_9AGAM|nr:hypothetical protein SCHPADRAFT_263309 [Schizopora paradoxa]
MIFRELLLPSYIASRVSRASPIACSRWRCSSLCRANGPRNQVLKRSRILEMPLNNTSPNLMCVAKDGSCILFAVVAAYCAPIAHFVEFPMAEIGSARSTCVSYTFACFAKGFYFGLRYFAVSCGHLSGQQYVGNLAWGHNIVTGKQLIRLPCSFVTNKSRTQDVLSSINLRQHPLLYQGRTALEVGVRRTLDSMRATLQR